MMNNKSLRAVLFASLVAEVLSAHTTTRQALILAMQANGRQMMSYQWKQKVTVIRKGNALDPFIEELRFDATGHLQKTTLVKPEERKMGPLKARKAADIKESVQEVMQLARSYASPQQIGQAIQKGEIWEGAESLRVQSRHLILPLDEMTMLINRSTYLVTRADFKTQHDGSPVSIAVSYSQLPNGPGMMTRMTVQIPKEDIVVQVESYDFIRLAGPTGR